MAGNGCAADQRLDDVSNPFTSAHFAVILAAVGDTSSCERLLEQMQAFSAQKEHALASRYAKAGLPAARAAIAHRAGEYEVVVEELMPCRHLLWQMGGSHAQQDLFFQLLIDAAVKLQQVELVAQLLRERELAGFVEPARRVAYEHATALLTDVKVNRSADPTYSSFGTFCHNLVEG